MSEKLIFAIAMVCVLIPILSISSKAQSAQTAGIIYIRADGSIDPPTTPITTVDNITYTFVDNITGSIVIQRSNTIVDGNGHELQGSGNGTGFYLRDVNNVTIKTTTVTNFTQAIWLDFSSNNTLSGNVAANSVVGVYLNSSSSNILSGNNVTLMAFFGIQLESSNDNILSGNNVVSDALGIELGSSNHNILSGNNVITNARACASGEGIELYDSSSNNISENNVTAKYWEGIRLTSSSCNVIANNIMTGCASGIMLEPDVGSSSDNILSGNNVTNNGYGIILYDSSGNSVSDNSVTASKWDGILLSSSSNNTLANNNMTGNTYNFGVDGSSLSDFMNYVGENNTVDGKPVYYWFDKRDATVSPEAGFVALVNCTGITLQGLNIKSNRQGILLAYTTNSIITKNNVTNNTIGIWLGRSSNNSISENNVANNSVGVSLPLLGSVRMVSRNNTIYHNSFIHNSQQAFDELMKMNAWDNGYPAGGNYWGDYDGSDVYRGICQNESGFDWIGDSPYVIDKNNADRYPLMNPYSSETGEMELAYRDLLVKFDQLQTSFNANISDLQGQVNILNSTANYFRTEVANLTLTLNQTSSSFQGQIDSLGNTITGLQGQINSLNSTLQTSISNAQNQYNSLSSQLDTMSKIMYLLAAMTAVLIVTAVYIAVRKQLNPLW